MASGTKTPNTTEEQDAAYNPGDAHYDDQFNRRAKAEELSDLESSGSTPYEGKNTDITDSENNGANIDDTRDREKRGAASSLYKGGKNIASSLGPDGLSMKDKIGKMFGVKMKPTYSVSMIIIMIAFGVVSLGSGATVFAAIEKGLTNDGSDDERANVILHRAINGLLGRADCKHGKIVCKMTTATKENVKKWKDNKFKVNGNVVDENGKEKKKDQQNIDPEKLEAGDRVAITSVEFPDSTKVDNPKDFHNKIDSDTDARSQATRVHNPSSASFFGSSFKNLLSSKIKVSKSAATAEERNTGKDFSDDEKIRQMADEEIKKSYPLDAKNAIKNYIKSGGLVGTTANSFANACMVYNMARMAVGAVKTKWALDLIRFAWPFVRIASKVADGSANKEEDFKEIEKRANQLVYYVSPTYAESINEKVMDGSLDDKDKTNLKNIGIKDPDDENKQEIVDTVNGLINENATDAQGLQMALYGDVTAVKEMALSYSNAALGSVVAAESVIGEAQAAFGGKRNLRTACILANAVGTGLAGTQLARCFTGPQSTAFCLGAAIAQAAKSVAIYMAAQKAILAALVLALKYAPLSLDLKGVAAGDALSAGIGLMLARKARSSGMQPAQNADQVKKFIAATDDIYSKQKHELAIYEAKSTPFDISNNYSFAGQLNQKLNPFIMGSEQRTGFGYVANMAGVLSNAFVAPTASALHSSPSLMTNDTANLNHRLNIKNGKPECRDAQVKEIELVCDWSGRMVGVLSDEVIKWAKEDAAGEGNNFRKTVEYMQKEQKANQENGGTNDDDCGTSDQIMAFLNNPAVAAGGDNGGCDGEGPAQPSIDGEGKPRENSQYDLFVKYCTGERELELGASDVDIDYGTERDQDWHNGKQCGTQSTMMNHFTYYYNMCYVQYATTNSRENCAEETPTQQTTDEAAPSECAGGGRKAIYTCALKYDDYGYVWGGGHDPGAKEWIKNFNAGKVAKWTPILDCSGLVRMAFVEAMGKDHPGLSSGAFISDPRWQKINPEDAEQGDVIANDQHIAIIKSNDKGAKRFETFDAQTESAPKENQIGHSSYAYGYGTVLRAKE